MRGSRTIKNLKSHDKPKINKHKQTSKQNIMTAVNKNPQATGSIWNQNNWHW